MGATQSKPVYVGQAWRVVLHDLGLDAEAVLRRAGQPTTLLAGDGSWVSLDDFYALNAAVAAEAGDPGVAVRAGTVVSAELFDPAYFAMICSPDLDTALRRLADHMRLVGPFALDIARDDAETAARLRCKVRPDISRIYGISQLAFLVALARRATRSDVVPKRIAVPGSTDDLGACEEFFGCPVATGSAFEVAFDALDTKRPFLTYDDDMWRAFEPGLRRRMAEAAADRTTSEEIEAALLELLPSGRTGMNEVSRELGIGTRTLQRRLASENTSWLDVLNRTRERLARHYFATTDLSPGQVSFLLGFEDSNSLYRAVRRWTGTTPELWRAAIRADGVASRS